MNLKSLFERKSGPYYINHKEQRAASILADYLLEWLPSPGSRPIVLVFVGTDRSTGDSLGPLTGTLLEEKPLFQFHHYGTLKQPVHALNLSQTMNEVKTAHEKPFIIGVDACLGSLKSVGNIQVGKGPVKPGSGVKKDLPPVGNIHIAGIVNVSGFMEFHVLQNTRLHTVMSMAQVIADGIAEAALRYSAAALLKERQSRAALDASLPARQTVMYKEPLFKEDVES